MRVNLKRVKDFFSNNPIWIFIILIPIIFILQFSLLKVILMFGISSEDWLLLFDHKIGGGFGNFFDKLSNIFFDKGIYSTTYIFYIGFLQDLFKGNYQAYQTTNIIFKTLATLSLYPLVLMIFKRRLLAFLTTTLYAISYSSAGALQFVVKGSDYIGIFLMNIFLITYYLSYKNKKISFLYLTTILLFLSFIFSPIRIYPLLLFVILIEFFVWVKRKGAVGLIFACLRLTLLLSPFLILLLFLPKSTEGYLNGPLVVLRFLSYGNYQLLLTPFSGLGYTFLPNDYWGIFGKFSFNNFKDYLSFLFHGPVIIYPILTILIGFLLTKRPKYFIIGIIFTNFIFEIVTYFFVTNIRGVVGPNVKGFYEISTYAIFFGFFVISIAISSLIVWLKNRRSNVLLLSLFIGPIFSSVFLWGTWLIIGDSLNYVEGIHWYLIIPPIGSSLFISSLMVLGFDKIKEVVNPYLRSITIICLFLIILPIYLISSREINTVFGKLHHLGYGASDQEEMKTKLLVHLKNPIDEKPALFYLDTSEDVDTPSEYYPVTLISGFGEKMHFRDWQVINGCVGLIYDKDTLKKSVVVENGVKGFTGSSLCVYNYFSVGRPEVFYKPENFYAFKLKNKGVTDIKENTLKELGF